MAEPLKLGKYTVLSRIGVGGMAEVYLCRMSGIGGFDKLVVLKRTLAGLDTGDHSDFANMFLDEARIAANLTHSNIAQIFEVDEIAGQPCIVMEFVSGPTFAALMKRAESAGRRHLGHYAKLVSGVCSGLHCAHNARDPRGEAMHIVHRDVTPQNIIISAEGVPKILDFGVAKARGKLVTTERGRIRGKVRFMAPEVMRGEPVDLRADLFSAAACLYEAATGRALYNAPSEPELFGAVMRGAFARPSEVVPGFPTALEEILLWGLESDPGKRCQSAFELREALEGFTRTGEYESSTHAVAQWISELFPQTEDSPVLRRFGTSPKQGSTEASPLPFGKVGSPEAAPSAAPPPPPEDISLELEVIEGAVPGVRLSAKGPARTAGPRDDPPPAQVTGPVVQGLAVAAAESSPVATAPLDATEPKLVAGPAAAAEPTPAVSAGEPDPGSTSAPALAPAAAVEPPAPVPSAESSTVPVSRSAAADSVSAAQSPRAHTPPPMSPVKRFAPAVVFAMILGTLGLTWTQTKSGSSSGGLQTGVGSARLRRSEFPPEPAEFRRDRTVRHEAVAVKPDEAVAVNPDEAVAVNPDEAVAVKPDEAVAVKPDEAVAVRPDEAVALKPDETVAVKPEEAVAVKPDEAVAVKPDEAVAVKPLEPRKNESSTRSVRTSPEKTARPERQATPSPTVPTPAALASLAASVRLPQAYRVKTAKDLQRVLVNVEREAAGAGAVPTEVAMGSTRELQTALARAFVRGGAAEFNPKAIFLVIVEEGRARGDRRAVAARLRRELDRGRLKPLSNTE